MSFSTISQTSISLTEDLTAKFNSLSQAKDPHNLVIDSLKQTILGAKTLKAEEVIIPVGCGAISLYTSLKNAEVAIHKFARCQIISGLFHTGIAGVAGFIAVYNFNNFINTAYPAGQNQSGNFWKF